MSLRPNRKPSLTLPLMMLAGFILCFGPAVLAQDATNTVAPKTTSPEPAVTDRVRTLEEELAKQNSKLDQLQKTVSQQQQAIQALLERLAGADPKLINASLSSSNSLATTTAPAAASSNSDASNSATPQTPTIEQRLAKVEGQALKIGPFRFSGDFRLRADAIFRSATKPRSAAPACAERADALPVAP